MKGILFQSWKIKAIAERSPDFEWQTRRLNGLKEINKEPDKWIAKKWGDTEWVFLDGEHIESKIIKPRLQIGDIVYIKEAWRVGAWNENEGSIAVDYKLDNFSAEEWHQIPNDDDGEKFNRLWIECSEEAEKAGMVYDFEGQYHWKPGESPCRWRSPMFMPEWAARYFIQITDVRVERLQAITFKDCLAEGIVDTPQWQELAKGDNYKPPEPLNPDDLSNEEADKEIDRGWIEYTRQAYAMLWNSINPKSPWSKNEWVWRIGFVRVDKPTPII